MKRLFILAIIALLSACSLLTESTTKREFDNVEYSLATTSAVQATRMVHQCTSSAEKTEFFKDQLAGLNTTTLNLYEYEANKANSAVELKMVNYIRAIVIELTTHDAYSKQYCIHKTSEIQSATRTFARTLGWSDKSQACDANVGKRFYAYKNSFDMGLITPTEFLELSGDLLQLQEIDEGACTVKQKEDLRKVFELISSLITALK